MDHSQLIRQEISVGTIKSIIGSIPYIGTALNEAIFETRSRIKQERINHFFEMLHSYFERHSNNGINFSECKSEEFSDLIEQTLLNVSKTRSKNKAIWFRNILINQIFNNHEIEKSELFVDILNTLRDKQVKILDGIMTISDNGVWKTNGERLLNETKVKKLQEEIDIRKGMGRPITHDNIEAEINFYTKKIEECKTAIASYAHLFDCKSFACAKNEFQYYLQDLTNKALVVDLSYIYEASILEVLKITDLGSELLSYIMNSTES